MLCKRRSAEFKYPVDPRALLLRPQCDKNLCLAFECVYITINANDLEVVKRNYHMYKRLIVIKTIFNTLEYINHTTFF